MPQIRIDRLVSAEAPQIHRTQRTPAEGNTRSRRAFVVREGGRWWLTVAGEDAPSVLSFDDLLAVIDASDVDPPETDPVAAVAPLDDDTYLTPAWSFVGAVTHTGLVTETATGATVVFDTDDLAVLDAITDPAPVTDITRRSGITDAPQRLARLAATAKIRVLHPEPAGTPTPTTDTPATRPTIAPTGTPDPGGAPGRIPVYAIWHPDIGPLLSLGMLTAAARAHPHLTDTYEIRRPETADSFLADLAGRTGPAILLCSDYVWSLTHNLDTARQAITINPQLLVIHGGPSSPKYPDDATTFLHTHAPIAHLLTRGEGEHLITELLTTLAPALTNTSPDQPWPPLPDTLTDITGLTYTHPTTRHTIRTPDRPRITDLDTLPSPYLTGEFDHIPGDAWTACLAIETNRGCPYGCTFCDWGSSTLSRIRKFDLDRVTAEIQWAAERRVEAINLADANFGIMSRDVETTQRVAELKARFGAPKYLVFYPAKNTTKHLTRIMDILGEADITSAASLSLQTVDPDSLQALDRTNISTDHFVALAADYRRRDHPLQGDLLLGIPGQTYESYKRDLQFMADHEILARTWPVQILPNAPMNDPDYRAAHEIAIEGGLVVATATFSKADRARMLRLRKIDLIMERYGVLRHVLRWLQWDHDLPALDVLDHLIHTTTTHPDRYPHLTWLTNYFDLHPTAPTGWTAVYHDLQQHLTHEHGIQPDTALDTVLTLQHALMPTPGRTFPHTIQLPHDYPTYYRDATTTLYTTGHAGTPTTPLHHHPPTTFTITADPLHLCDNGLPLDGDSRDDANQGQFQIGATVAHELESPLMRYLPHVHASGVAPPERPAVALSTVVGFPIDADLDDPDLLAGAGVSVALGRTTLAGRPTG